MKTITRSGGTKCMCCGAPYTESIQERRAMRLASLMVRLMRRCHRARREAMELEGETARSWALGARCFNAEIRYKTILEQLLELMFQVKQGKEVWL